MFFLRDILRRTRLGHNGRDGCSPDGAKRHPGTMVTLAQPFPHFAALNAGYRLPLRSMRATGSRNKANGRGKPRPSPYMTPGLARLFQRLDPHDRGAVVVADPEHRPRTGFLDEHA